MLWARIPRAITINVAEVESPPLDDREAHLVQFTEPAATCCAHSFRTNWCRQPYPRADVDRRLTSPQRSETQSRHMVGATADSAVFWAAGDGVALLVGDDAETWDVSVRVSFAAVDEIVRLLDAGLS